MTNDDMLSQISDLHAELSNLKQRMTSMMASEEDKRREIQHLREALEHGETQSRDTQAELARVKNLLADAERALSDQRASGEARVDDLRASIARREDELTHELVLAKKRLEDEGKRGDYFEEQARKFDQEAREQKNKLRMELEDGRHKLEAEAKELQSTIRNLEHKCQGQERLISEREADVHNLQHQVDILSRKLDQQAESFEVVEARYQESQKTIEELRKHLREAMAMSRGPPRTAFELQDPSPPHHFRDRSPAGRRSEREDHSYSRGPVRGYPPRNMPAHTGVPLSPQNPHLRDPHFRIPEPLSPPEASPPRSYRQECPREMGAVPGEISQDYAPTEVRSSRDRHREEERAIPGGTGRLEEGGKRSGDSREGIEAKSSRFAQVPPRSVAASFSVAEINPGDYLGSASSRLHLARHSHSRERTHDANRPPTTGDPSLNPSSLRQSMGELKSSGRGVAATSPRRQPGRSPGAPPATRDLQQGEADEGASSVVMEKRLMQLSQKKDVLENMLAKLERTVSRKRAEIMAKREMREELESVRKEISKLKLSLRRMNAL